MLHKFCEQTNQTVMPCITLKSGEKRQRAGMDGSDRWNNFAEAREPGKRRIHQPLQQEEITHQLKVTKKSSYRVLQ